VPNSINIGIDGSFAPWVGTLITDIKQPILIVADEGRAEEVVTRLARVGYDYCIGYLQGGFEAWKAEGKEIDTIQSINAATFYNESLNEQISIVDVRKKVSLIVNKLLVPKMYHWILLTKTLHQSIKIKNTMCIVLEDIDP
jgi:hypothetical protein